MLAFVMAAAPAKGKIRELLHAAHRQSGVSVVADGRAGYRFLAALKALVRNYLPYLQTSARSLLCAFAGRKVNLDGLQVRCWACPIS